MDKKGSYVYVIASNKVIRDAEDGTFGAWVEFLNGILEAIVLDGTKGEFEKLTVEKMLSENSDIDAKEAEDSDIPIAKPLPGQHTHLDFLNKTKTSMSLFGGLLAVNQTGTEYSFESIADMADNTDSSELASLLTTIADADTEDFDLVDTAHDMAELFRVSVDSFDAGHDREQEILGGMIQRAAVYNTFRSFAWTLQAFCEMEGCQPVDLDYETIEALVSFIEDRNGLNYVSDSFSPAICSGDDLHTYFVSDSVSEDVKNQLLHIANRDAGDDAVAICDIRSLDALRKELDYMYPAIKAIYDELEANRDRDEALVTGTADILYAWCSMTYAARQPVFTEDGPMNCWWEHPDNQEDWETKWKIERLQECIKQSKEWVKQHSKDISRNTTITFKDKTFVFTGVEGLDEWLDILQRLTDLGGIHRGAVSGKTNYLVCNPMYGGDSKVKHALEQRIKGKDVKIILFEDFLKAIKMTVKTPEEELAELTEEKEKKPTEKRIKEVKRTACKTIEAAEFFTYSEGLQGTGDGYILSIPDGFVVKPGEEDRDFIAYLPDDDNPDDYLESRFIIFAGQKQENEIFGQLRTVAEYSSIVRGLSSSLMGAFADTKVVTYERKDLPGGLVYGFDPGCLHVNAYVGVGDHIQMMRLQISGVTRRNRASYELVAKNIFDKMMPVTPVEMLKELDDDEFLMMSMDGTAVSKWTDCVEEYVNHFSVARNIWQNALVGSFQDKQNSGDADVQQLKKDIKKMLRGVSEYVETELKKAELVYVLKRLQYPGNINLDKMKSALDSLTELATQYVNLDNQQIKVESELSKKVEARFEIPAVEAIERILSDADETYKKSSLTLLERAKIDSEKALKEAEEERKRKAAEEAERKRIEAEQKAAEEKRLAEERERKRKEEEERRKAEAERLRKEREAAQKKYEVDYKQWMAECETIKRKRDVYVSEQIAAEMKTLIDAATRKKDEAVADTKSMISSETSRKQAAEAMLASLGMFKFGEKKAQKAIIEEATKKISDAQSALSAAESTFNSEIAEAETTANSKATAFNEAAAKAYPMPSEPKKPV